MTLSIPRIWGLGLLIYTSVGINSYSYGSDDVGFYLNIYTEELPPYNFLDSENNVGGFSTEILRHILDQSGVAYKIELFPWQRAYQMAIDGSNACVYSTTVTDERRPLFKWVTPLVKDNWVLLSQKNRGLKITSLEDAKAYKIGGYRESARAIFMQKLGFDLDLASNDIANARKLNAGHIDLLISTERGARWVAKMAGVSGLETAYVIKPVELGLACNKNVPDTIINMMNSKLKDAWVTGYVDSIVSKY